MKELKYVCVREENGLESYSGYLQQVSFGSDSLFIRFFCFTWNFLILCIVFIIKYIHVLLTVYSLFIKS